MAGHVIGLVSWKSVMPECIFVDASGFSGRITTYEAHAMTRAIPAERQFWETSGLDGYIVHNTGNTTKCTFVRPSSPFFVDMTM